MKSIYIIGITFLSFLMSAGQVSADTIPDNSIIFGTWAKENSPYVIMGEVTVPEDSTLLIEAGVTVKLKSSISDSAFYYPTLDVGFIRINGRVVAIGTEGEPIIFTRNGEGNWGSMSFLQTTEEPNIFKHCEVSYGNNIYDFLCPDNNFIGGLAFISSSAIIENSLFEYNPFGVYCESSNIVIENCNLRFNGDGILIFLSTAFINNNVVYDNEDDGILSHTSNSTIINNLIEENIKGIVSYESFDTISNNIAKNNLWNGISVMRNNSIVNNNIIYGSNSGIECSGAPRLLNNTIVFNHYFGIYCRVGAKPIIANSIIFGNHGLIYYNPDDVAVIANSLVQVDSFPEVVIDAGGNIFNQGPCFVDTLNEDFSLLENSPCVNTGLSFFVWENDTILNLSPDNYVGPAPDIGAIESEYLNVGYENLLTKPEKLSQNYPNPFYKSTKIQVNISDEQATLSIYDFSGLLVKTYIINNKGDHNIIWDGTTNSGTNAVSGIYYYQLKCKQGTFSNSMILLK